MISNSCISNGVCKCNSIFIKKNMIFQEVGINAYVKSIITKYSISRQPVF